LCVAPCRIVCSKSRMKERPRTERAISTLRTQQKKAKSGVGSTCGWAKCSTKSNDNGVDLEAKPEGKGTTR